MPNCHIVALGIGNHPGPDMRCAIFFVPPADDPLQLAAAQWLRRDPYTGARIASEVQGLVERDHAFLTAVPRRLGFHGTLKAPFRLDDGIAVEHVAAALDKFCRRLTPIDIPTMEVVMIQNAFALVPAIPVPDLTHLAADVVTTFDVFRSPTSDMDMARGDTGRFTREQFDNLRNWGHPNVFAQFRYHMTLTGPIDELERDHVMVVLQHHFGQLAKAPIHLAQLALFIEPEPNAPFLVHSTHQFSVQRQRKIA